MAFRQCWSIAQKQWKFLVVCFVIAGLSAFIISKLITPIYQSTVLIVVTIRSANNQSDYSSLLASDQLVQTEAQLAMSDPVLREVASHYSGVSVEQLARQVTATTKLNTQLFEIDAQDASPLRAAALANDIATTLIRQQLLITQQDDIRSQQQIQQDLNTTRLQIDGVTTHITLLQSQGGKQSQIAVLQAQLSGLQQHYSQWQNALAQLELAEAQDGDFLRIAQPAQPSTAPIRPQVLLNTVVGLAAGLLLGMLLAVLVEQMDTRVRTPEALAWLFDCPVLATIWLDNSAKEELVNPQEQSINVEAYHILRTNVGISYVDKSLRSIVVTSALPQEGKSTIAANLAIFMAKAGKETLLIDANLRHPSLYQKFGIPVDKMGLSNAIIASSQRQFSSPLSLTQSGSSLASAISLEPYTYTVGVPNLRVMPSGPLPPNPPDLLASKALERFFLALARCRAEVIIIDTPPLLELSDTYVFISKVDGTLLVTDITRANKGNLERAKTILAQAGACVLGCVVNKEHQQRGRRGYFHERQVEHSSEESSKTRDGNTPSVHLNPALPMISIPQRMQSR
jgi:tyrosine-protein kinase